MSTNLLECIEKLKTKSTYVLEGLLAELEAYLKTGQPPPEFQFKDEEAGIYISGTQQVIKAVKAELFIRRGSG